MDRCEFCQDGEIIEDETTGAIIRLQENNGHYGLEFNNDVDRLWSSVVDINYCPICGKKL